MRDPFVGAFLQISSLARHSRVDATPSCNGCSVISTQRFSTRAFFDCGVVASFSTPCYSSLFAISCCSSMCSVGCAAPFGFCALLRPARQVVHLRHIQMHAGFDFATPNLHTASSLKRRSVCCEILWTESCRRHLDKHE